MSLGFIATGGFGDDQPAPPPLTMLFKIASKDASLVGKALRYSLEEGACPSAWEMIL